MLASKLLMTVGGEETLYSDSVFSAYTYVGNGTTQTINNGIDLAGKGGVVWVKSRTDAYYPYLFDTARGAGQVLLTNHPTGQFEAVTALTGFNGSGFTVGADITINASASSEISWTFRQSPKFFLNTTVTKSSGSNATVDLSSLGTVGMVMVKRTDAAGSWYVFHRSATAGKLLYLEQTAAEATLGHITVSGTTLTLVNGVIADGSYVVYAWAHDTSGD